MISEDDVAKHYELPPEQQFYLTECLALQPVAYARESVADSNDWPTFQVRRHDRGSGKQHKRSGSTNC